jgi:hypothetical protein
VATSRAAASRGLNRVLLLTRLMAASLGMQHLARMLRVTVPQRFDNRPVLCLVFLAALRSERVALETPHSPCSRTRLVSSSTFRKNEL